MSAIDRRIMKSAESIRFHQRERLRNTVVYHGDVYHGDVYHGDGDFDTFSLIAGDGVFDSRSRCTFQ